MENWKKYEGYVDEKLMYIINLNKDFVKKNMNDMLFSLLNVITISDYSFKSRPNIIKVSANIKENTLDDEIKEKLRIVDMILTKNRNNELIFSNIETFYNQFNNIKKEIDPNNDYSKFLTDDEVNEKKIQMKNLLNDLLKFLEINTDDII